MVGLVRVKIDDDPAHDVLVNTRQIRDIKPDLENANKVHIHFIDGTALVCLSTIDNIMNLNDKKSE